MDIIYFDNAATTKIKREVLEEMIPYLGIEYGNPSSLYFIGSAEQCHIIESITLNFAH